jgi:large subunit ribosomal protein L9
MQVILIKDIKTLGRTGEVKNVSDGYGSNFLIPQKLAVLATPQKIAELKKHLSKIERENREKSSQEQDLAVRLQGMRLEVKAKASDGGKLFAGLTGEDIANELKTQRKITVPENKIKLKKHIKEIGEHQILIDCGQGLKAEIIIKVIPLT